MYSASPSRAVGSLKAAEDSSPIYKMKGLIRADDIFV